MYIKILSTIILGKFTNKDNLFKESAISLYQQFYKKSRQLMSNIYELNATVFSQGNILKYVLIRITN